MVEMDEADGEQGGAAVQFSEACDGIAEQGDGNGADPGELLFTSTKAVDEVEKQDEFDGDAKADEASAAAPKALSKNAQKNLLKMERFRERKLQRKALEKERRHHQTAQKREEWRAKQASLSEEDREKALQERLASRAMRKSEGNERKERLRQAMQTGQNLVLDLEFCDLMKPNEVTSLVQQVRGTPCAGSFSYSN